MKLEKAGPLRSRLPLSLYSEPYITVTRDKLLIFPRFNITNLAEQPGFLPVR